MGERKPPKLAVWKFASCDGCQLSLLDCEDELLTLAEAVHIANFPEASSAIEDGPYDLSLVEGSITTAHDAPLAVKVAQNDEAAALEGNPPKRTCQLLPTGRINGLLPLSWAGNCLCSVLQAVMALARSEFAASSTKAGRLGAVTAGAAGGAVAGAAGATGGAGGWFSPASWSSAFTAGAASSGANCGVALNWAVLPDIIGTSAPGTIIPPGLVGATRSGVAGGAISGGGPKPEVRNPL